jgi:hypothetical protein
MQEDKVRGIYVKGLKEVVVSDAAGLDALMVQGNSMRTQVPCCRCRAARVSAAASVSVTATAVRCGVVRCGAWCVALLTGCDGDERAQQPLAQHLHHPSAAARHGEQGPQPFRKGVYKPRVVVPSPHAARCGQLRRLQW